MGAKYDLGSAEGKIKIVYDGGDVDKAIKDQDKLGSSSAKAGTQIKEVSNKAGIAGLVIAGGMGLAAKSAIDFEQQISAIAAVSNASGSELDQLRKKALQLGADTQFSASEAATAMEELAKAGINTTDILNGAADATVALAAAGGVDLPTAATLAANAMNSFGITAQQMPGVVNKIAGAANASAIDVGEFGFSLQQVGAVAHLAGLSFSDTATAIAELGNAGIKGSDAGTSLKTFLQNLIPQTKQQTTLFKQLGLETKNGANQFFDAKGKLKSFADVSQILQNALKGMSKEQQLATLQTIFGSDAMRAAAVFAGQGASGFNTLNDAIDKTTAADVAAKRMDNTAGRIEQLKGSAETAAIAFGELLLPAIDKLAKLLTQLANWLTGLSSTWQNTILVVLGAVGAFLLIVGAIGKIIEIMKVFRAAWLLLNLAFEASPIGLIILAIILLVAAFYLLWTRSSAFRNFFIGIWNAIWSFLKTIGAWFAGPFANFFVEVWHKAQTAWNAIWGVIKVVIDFIVGYFQFLWGIVSAVFGFFEPLIKGVFDAVLAIVTTWWAVFSALWTVVFTVLRAILEPFINWLVGFWKWAFGIVSAVVQVWWAGFSAFWGAVWGFLKNVALAWWATFSGFWKGIWDFLSAAFKIWWAVFSGYWTTIWTFIKTVWDIVVGIIKGAINQIGAVFDTFASLLGKVRDFFNRLKDAASGGVGSLLAFVKGIPGQILSALGNLASLLYDSGVKMIQGLIDGIKNMAGKAKDAAKDVLGAIRNLFPFSPAKEGPFSGKGWTLYSGQSLMEGFATGLDQATDAAVLAMATALAKVQGQTGSGSPITVPAVALGPAAGGGTTSSTDYRPTTVNNNVSVTVPAPITDPAAIASYAIRKLNNSVSTRSIPVGPGLEETIAAA